MTDIIATAISEASTLQQLIDTYTPFVQEVKIHFNDDGLGVCAVDPANVMLADTTVDTAAFESYDAPGEAVVGVNLVALDDRLDAANNGDLVEIALDMEARKLRIQYRTITHTMALIDPDAIRAEPDLPELELPNRATVEGSLLAEAIDVAGMVSDHIYLRGDPDNERVRVEAQGDSDETTVDWGREQVIDAQVDEQTESVYSHEYIEELAAPIPNDAEVTITFGDAFPLLAEWSASDGHQQTTHSLAPRIQSR